MKALQKLRRGGLPAKFKPEEAHKREAQATAVIGYAKQVRAWPMLEAAIAQKLEDQAAFVAWWAATVTLGKGRYPRGPKVTDRLLLPVDEAEKLTGITKMQVSRWHRRLQDPEAYRASLYGEVYAKAMAETNNTIATKWTGDPEWYTPEQYIEAARAVMGGIDLDPASTAVAQKTVKATHWFGKEEDGLAEPWHGRVFLNPPYAFPDIEKFVEKLCTEVEAARVTAAILLTNNNTDTAWWHQAAHRSEAICFTLGRIKFYKADGGQSQPTNGQTFFYFGNDKKDFKSVFEHFGFIVRL